MIKFKTFTEVEMQKDGVTIQDQADIAFFTNGYVTYGFRKNESFKQYIMEFKIDLGLFKLPPKIFYRSKRKPRIKNIRFWSLIFLPCTILFFFLFPVLLTIAVYASGALECFESKNTGARKFFRVMNWVFLTAAALFILIKFIIK